MRHYDDERGTHEGLREVWSDRLSADRLRNRVLAELTAQCRTCGADLSVEITGSSYRWYVNHLDITRDDDGDWRHAGRCRGQLRFLGKLPPMCPHRIILNGGSWPPGHRESRRRVADRFSPEPWRVPVARRRP